MASSSRLKLAAILLAVSGFLYKSITQRSPVFLLASPPPLPPSISSSCTKNFPELLRNCEDFSILPNTTLLFLSCDRSRREWYHAFRAFPPNVPKGEIFLWDYGKPEVAPTLLSEAESLGADFHPLGISAVARGEEDEVRLFVTNQAKKEARIEVLDVNLETRTARHKRSLTDVKIFSPNGIVGVDENSFFITNDGFFSRRWSTALMLEVLLGAPGGQVVHVSIPPPASAAGEDSVDAFSVAWISLANGLALDRAQQKLYIASSTHGVYTYSIPDMSRPYLAVPESFHRTPFATDNLHLGPTGRLFASGISSLGDFATSMLSEGGGTVGPPAWTVELLSKADPGDRREVVLRGLDPANSPLRKEEWLWRSVYLDDGKFFGGVSTGGVVDMQGTFVGVSVVGRGVLVCEAVIERPGIPAGAEKVKEEL